MKRARLRMVKFRKGDEIRYPIWQFWKWRQPRLRSPVGIVFRPAKQGQEVEFAVTQRGGTMRAIAGEDLMPGDLIRPDGFEIVEEPDGSGS